VTDRHARPTLLLVHGAWHGAWCWEKLTAVLEEQGWRTLTVDLPSAGGLAGVADDARVIRAELEAVDGPVVVVAHSYGGIPVGQAVAGAGNVERIVYLAAFQLDVGESMLSFYGVPAPTEPKDHEPVPDNPVTTFYGDLPPAEGEEAARRLVPQSARSFSDALTAAGWHTVPSTYIVCEQDQALPEASQLRLAERSGAVHRMAAGHSPFLSQPAELAALLMKIALGSDS
jgi:pimeloyl-ACP methyl ester carboxylesterase